MQSRNTLHVPLSLNDLIILLVMYKINFPAI